MGNTAIKQIEDKIKKDGGCLCYVWNEEQNNPNKKIMIVKNVRRENSPCFFNDGWSCVYYRNAEPISEDIKKYLI